MNFPDYTKTCEAIRYGLFAQWPKNIQERGLKTIAPWSLSTCRTTPFHWAAEAGHLSQIPKEFLTEKALLTPDDKGRTPLHYAARESHLDQTPIKLRLSTLKALLEWEATSEASQAWLKNEIQARKKKEVQESLQNCDHPEL